MRLKYYFVLASLFAFLSALMLLISSQQDAKILDQAIEGKITSRANSGTLVEELNSWVYHHQGFAKNRGYFIFKKLGPTPIQVLQSGGDCADKSRLLSALLKRLGMDSTLVMLYACEGCESTHTVVDVRYQGGRMAADPVFNIVFPAGNGKFYGVKELREDPLKLLSRLDELRIQRGPTDRIGGYKWETESYSWPKTINWEKNSLLSRIATLIQKTGTDPFLVMRPHFLEDPKLFLMYVTLFFGVAAGLVAIALHNIGSRKQVTY